MSFSELIANVILGRQGDAYFEIKEIKSYTICPKGPKKIRPFLQFYRFFQKQTYKHDQFWKKSGKTTMAVQRKGLPIGDLSRNYACFAKLVAFKSSFCIQSRLLEKI